MKKVSKKLASFLLCAALVLGVTPIMALQGGNTASASENASTAYVYNFAGASAEAAAGTGYDGNQTDPSDSEWKIAEKCSMITVAPNASYLGVVGSYALGLYSETAYVTMHIYVPEAGTYKLNFTCWGSTNNATLDVYAGEGALTGYTPVAGLINDAYKLGSIPQNTVNAYFKAPMDVKNLEVSAPGYYTIVFWGAKDGKSAYFKSLSLTPVDVADEPITLVYKYNSVPTEDTWDGSATDYADAKWQISSAVCPGFNNNVNDFVKSTETLIKIGNTSKRLYDSDANRNYLITEIYVPVAGTYDITVNSSENSQYFSCFDVSASSDTDTAYNLMGSVISRRKTDKSYNYSDLMTNKLIVDEPGYYRIAYIPQYYNGTTNPYGYQVWLTSLVLDRHVEKVEIDNADKFGDVSAYITETAEGIKFTAFSGIDSTNYSEVGFYINGTKFAVEGGKVYENITVNYGTGSESFAASKFFESTTPDKPYVFFSSATVSAGAKVTFQPYAIPVNGTDADVIYGYEYSVTLS